jgi:hypothetical protein
MSGTTLPLVMTAQGPVASTPAALRTALINAVQVTTPGYTVLPGGLIADISGTDVGAMATIDQARVDTINALTPLGANAFLLTQLGQIYGVAQGVGVNTSVYVVFTGPAGYFIGAGFIVSDGTYQYVVQTGGSIGSTGQSAQLYALAVSSGTWAIPANTVTQIKTSVPSTISLFVTNPNAGVPSTSAQTEADYRSQVLQAGLASATGMTRFLKTTLENVSGVQARLVSVRAQTGGGWEIIVGGGDPYQVAGAIYASLFDISTLVGSVLAVTAITQANPGVVTTNLNHGYATGQVVQIAGAMGMTAVNGVALTITVLTQNTFSIGVNTTSYGAYTSGGVVTPNLRNTSATVYDYPDQYSIPIVLPPQQAVTITVTWNTVSTNLIAPSAVAQLAQPALVNYVNSVAVGQPLNLFELQNAFQEAVASIIPAALLTRMVFSVAINGIGVSPTSGTGIIAGDPESYFETTASAITVTQG